MNELINYSTNIKKDLLIPNMKLIKAFHSSFYFFYIHFGRNNQANKSSYFTYLEQYIFI